MTIDASEFPQLARMEAVAEKSQSIGEFVEWLQENGMSICSTQPGLRGTTFWPVMETTEALLARHFEIDLPAVERERRKVLASCAAA